MALMRNTNLSCGNTNSFGVKNKRIDRELQNQNEHVW
jgi:hypothetical protein